RRRRYLLAEGHDGQVHGDDAGLQWRDGFRRSRQGRHVQLRIRTHGDRGLPQSNCRRQTGGRRHDRARLRGNPCRGNGNGEVARGAHGCRCEPIPFPGRNQPRCRQTLSGHHHNITREGAMADHNAAVAGSRELLICFSHLRWNFVYQRPQHLISRFARQYDVMHFEEPVHDSDTARLEVRPAADGLDVLVPHIPAGEDAAFVLKHLLDEHLRAVGREPSVLWYYTPMSVPFSAHLPRQLVVYDCMDELSAFRGAPAQMLAYEKRLLGMADIVFTGGHSLYETKRSAHPNVHVFPSSVDKEHFLRARAPDTSPEPEDQAGIPRPRLGFYGVVDERMDLQLVGSIAQMRPDWHIVIVGPIVKIDPSEVPDRPNIHYLGGRQYEDLPAYLGGWDVAIMPIALNESTRYIHPTKTPESLA